jgi:hypothetical protein
MLLSFKIFNKYSYIKKTSDIVAKQTFIGSVSGFVTMKTERGWGLLLFGHIDFHRDRFICFGFGWFGDLYWDRDKVWDDVWD